MALLRDTESGATNKLVAKRVFRQFKVASPFDICSAFGAIGNRGELKELETEIMGTYRQRICDLNLASEGTNLNTGVGQQLLSKFRRAQTMQDLAMALSATRTSPPKRRESEDDELTEVVSVVLGFEKILRRIFQEVDTTSGLRGISELCNDATLDATVGLVRAVSNAVCIIDGKMIMGSVAGTLNSLYHPQKEATLDSVKPYLAQID